MPPSSPSGNSSQHAPVHQPPKIIPPLRRQPYAAQLSLLLRPQQGRRPALPPPSSLARMPPNTPSSFAASKGWIPKNFFPTVALLQVGFLLFVISRSTDVNDGYMLSFELSVACFL
ncbi:hypothetical protein LINPERHAP1_LOCUS21571 [Linum perenne]